jgi:hypothetical protein
MGIISKKEKDKLFIQVKHLLGYPRREVELTSEMMETYLETAIEDYSAGINNWLIEQQWGNLQYLGLSTTEVTYALTSKTLDFERSFSNAYSKQVGLASGSPNDTSELKKDYVVVSGNTQVYNIPAGREINEILWHTPPDSSLGGIDPNANNWVVSPNGNGWNYGGQGASMMQPTYFYMASMQDMSMKKKLFQSELTFRVTAGPNGTKNLYLYPIPGSRDEMSSSLGKHLDGSKVWYFYYETNQAGRKKCLEKNSDIIKLPSDIPVDNLTWEKLNSISKTRIRKLFVAYSKIAMGNIRGMFSGQLKPGQIEVTMDYKMLQDQGETEKKEVMEELFLSLERLSLKNLMADRAQIAEDLNRVLAKIPFQKPIFTL